MCIFATKTFVCGHQELFIASCTALTYISDRGYVCGHHPSPLWGAVRIDESAAITVTSICTKVTSAKCYAKLAEKVEARFMEVRKAYRRLGISILSIPQCQALLHPSGLHKSVIRDNIFDTPRQVQRFARCQFLRYFKIAAEFLKAIKYKLDADDTISDVELNVRVKNTYHDMFGAATSYISLTSAALEPLGNAFGHLEMVWQARCARNERPIETYAESSARWEAAKGWSVFVKAFIDRGEYPGDCTEDEREAMAQEIFAPTGSDESFIGSDLFYLQGRPPRMFTTEDHEHSTPQGDQAEDAEVDGDTTEVASDDDSTTSPQEGETEAAARDFFGFSNLRLEGVEDIRAQENFADRPEYVATGHDVSQIGAAAQPMSTLSPDLFGPSGIFGPQAQARNAARLQRFQWSQSRELA